MSSNNSNPDVDKPMNLVWDYSDISIMETFFVFTQITLLFPLTQDCYRVKLTLLTILLELNIVSYYRITK